MAKRAQNQIRKRVQAAGEPSEVEQLCLDGIEIKNFCLNIKKMLETCLNLEYLTMNDCKLKSLENFPRLPKLVVLQLSDNELTGEDFEKLSQVSAINFLTLDNNKIQQASNLKKLTCLPQLQMLQIHDNSISESDEYRDIIFSYLPNLKAIDCIDKLGKRLQEEDVSQYFSYRQPRSQINLNDFFDENQNDHKIISLNKAVSEQRLKRETNISPGGSLYVATKNNQNRPHFNIMHVRTSIQDSEDQQEKDLYKDFRKKLFKKNEE